MMMMVRTLMKCMYHTLFHFFSNNLRGRYYLCLHLANEETEARTGSLLAQVAALGNSRFQPKDPGSRVCGLSNDPRSLVRGSSSEGRRRSQTHLGSRLCDSLCLYRIPLLELCKTPGDGLFKRLVFIGTETWSIEEAPA